MNRLFVAYKPSGIGSNKYLYTLKNKYKNKKAGFAGTLDPFAKGVLLVGFGSHTKLFRFLNKTPKTYKATLWLGAKSDTLDTEMIEEVAIMPSFPLKKVQKALCRCREIWNMNRRFLVQSVSTVSVLMTWHVQERGCTQ